jgi:hypothetical protein
MLMTESRLPFHFYTIENAMGLTKYFSLPTMCKALNELPKLVLIFPQGIYIREEGMNAEEEMGLKM